jgi:glycosyltransferase involved in cell wall biosynthesis
MVNLFCTADNVDDISGGGIVTNNEYIALKETGPVTLIDRKIINTSEGPFMTDYYADQLVNLATKRDRIKHAHFYAGTFSKTIRSLKSKGVLVSYTAAAHNIEDSRREHHLLKIKYDYPHINDPNLWEMYVEGYKEADIVICPSKYSADIMKSFDCKDVRVIPHGCHIPPNTVQMPKQFTVGYLGAPGPDKGIVYLLKAWEKLNLKNAVLVIAGRDSSALLPYIRKFKYGNIRLRGWIDEIRNFYDNISLYVQPSITEGFGIEIIEALAHGRPVIASDGAGASECVTDNVTGYVVEKRNVDELAEKIKHLYDNRDNLHIMAAKARNDSVKYDWPLIRQQYISLWNRI